MRTLRWWFLLAVAFLLFSGVYSQRAPCGYWMNTIFGHDAWLENDPGAYYLASAHELEWRQTPLYVGHPGATLTPLLLGVQSMLYALEAPAGTSFTRFTAQNLPQVFLLSKLLMTILHLVSFAALYALSKELLRDTRAAAFAVLGYATSFPVLYFLSRISVEPLMVTFFAVAFLAVWRCQDRLAEGRVRAALVYVAIAAFAAISGLATKLVFLGPLPFFLLLHILMSSGREAWRTRIGALCVFAAVGLAAFLAYSQIIDWGAFSHQWTKIATREVPERAPTVYDFLPGFGSGRIFLLAELGFGALAAIGWVRFLLTHRNSSGRALWLSAYSGYALLVFVYRVAREGTFLPFHYFFVTQAFLSVFFGFFTAELWRRLRMPSSGWRTAIAGLAWLLLLHGVGAWAVVDARRYDAAAFEDNRSALTLVAQLGPSDRIAIEVAPGAAAQAMDNLNSLHGITFPFFWSKRRSALGDEFASLFVPISQGAIPEQKPRTPAPALGGNLVVVGPSQGGRR